jgi:hypothetical protein
MQKAGTLPADIQQTLPRPDTERNSPLPWQDLGVSTNSRRVSFELVAHTPVASQGEVNPPI